MPLHRLSQKGAADARLFRQGRPDLAHWLAILISYCRPIDQEFQKVGGNLSAAGIAYPVSLHTGWACYKAALNLE